MAEHDITCREVVEVVTDFLEGRLPVDDRDRLERHLAMCDWCGTYLDQMGHTLTAVGHLQADDVAPTVIDSLTEAFRRRRRPAAGG